mgnify:CR=1 FL=1
MSATLGLTRAEYLRKAEQHDSAGWLALSNVLTPSDPELAARLWKRRDEYFALAASRQAGA